MFESEFWGANECMFFLTLVAMGFPEIAWDLCASCGVLGGCPWNANQIGADPSLGGPVSERQHLHIELWIFWFWQGALMAKFRDLVNRNFWNFGDWKVNSQVSFSRGDWCPMAGLSSFLPPRIFLNIPPPKYWCLSDSIKGWPGVALFELNLQCSILMQHYNAGIADRPVKWWFHDH